VRDVAGTEEALRRLGAREAIEHLAAQGMVVNSASTDLDRLCTLVADGRLDPQVALERSWRDPAPAIDALLGGRVGGKVVLHVD
jgi:NADPH:quinone reductase-like Zn-dependent oxidoreductase